MSVQKKDDVIIIEPIQRVTIDVAVIGERPLIHNRMSEKAKRELLLPGGRKTAADKAANLKHNPLEEFRASPYLLPDEYDTFIGIMSSAFKGAMMTAALDMPGAAKSKIGRLVYVHGDYVPVYGIPELLMSVTRSAGMNATPDIRTRAVMPKWAAFVRISFAVPLLNEQSILNLLAAAGMTAGVGDWRPEKGKGDYGRFRISNPDDADFLEIVENQGRLAQGAAMESPAFYDEQSAELFAWYGTEVRRQGKLR